MRRRSANDACGDATPSNKPLECTGHHEFTSGTRYSLPTTQGAALARAGRCAEVASVATMWLRLQAVAVVRAKLVKIGNSRGVRLAKPLLEVAGLADEVEIEAAPGVLTIRPSAHPRAGWAEAASSFEPEGLLDEMSATRFDDEEWSW